MIQMTIELNAQLTFCLVGQTAIHCNGQTLQRTNVPTVVCTNAGMIS